MKHLILTLISLLLAFTSANAQVRVVDALDHLPVSAASVFDASGNMAGYTTSNGTLSEIPLSAYPITLRCMGYEQLVIDTPDEKTWEMVPVLYELEELVVVPVERNMLRQTFYAREYFSLISTTDTINYFVELMTERFVPTSKEEKFSGNTSLRTLNSRAYARYKAFDEDSCFVQNKTLFPSMLSVLDIRSDEILAPESFKSDENKVKIYEKQGKSGVSLIYKQNPYNFTIVEDMLAKKKEHTASPWALKLLGISMDVKQLYTTNVYKLNEKGVYQPKDLKETSFVFEADGKGKLIRKALNSDKPVIIRAMVEIYLTDIDYLSQQEAKEAYDNKRSDVDFVIPASVPPLNKATRELVERAVAESESK